MKKRIGAVLLAFVLLATAFGITSFAKNGKVEISFCVGDENLKINGNETTVEKPYVVGEGVTLVPLRVITEAFGATVEWIGETKTVNLTYPDVNIVLQIGNNVAEVNKKAETLLSAPELTPNGITMVPLRFISETFGAEVSYDAETKAITVIKETNQSQSAGLESAVTSKYIGDSFYGWSMENPVDMQMDTRSFDGTYTSFSYDEDNYIEVSIAAADIKDYDFDREFNDLKSSFAGYTLIKADKKVSDNQKMMHVKGKDKSCYYDIIQIITDKYILIASGTFSNEDTKRRDEFVKGMETFACTQQTDMHDLSNVKDGVRRFKTENARFSIDIPQDFLMLSDEEAENEFRFCSIWHSDNSSEIHAAIYSKNEVGSAKTMANKDFKLNKEALNEKIVTFSASVDEMKLGEHDAYEYTYEVNSEVKKEFVKDVFFEIGEYVYNVMVAIKLPDNEKEKTVQTVLDSIEALEIDPEVMGNIMRNMPEDAEGTFEYDDLINCKLVIPNNYTEAYTQDGAAVFNNQMTGTVVTVEVITDKEQLKFNDAKEALKESESLQAKNGFKITEKTHEVVIGDKKWVKTCAVKTEDENVIYMEIFAIAKAGRIYAVSAAYDEMTYSNKARKEVEAIIRNMEFGKAD